MNTKPYLIMMNILLLLMAAGAFLFGNMVTFTVIYMAIFIFTAIRTIRTSSAWRVKLSSMTAYFTVFVLQMVANVQIVGDITPDMPVWAASLRHLLGVSLMLLPVLVSRYITVDKYSRFYLPSLQEVATVSLSEAKNYARQISDTMERLSNTGKTLSQDNLKEIISDLPRHDSFRYINNGSLTDFYFQKAAESLSDPYIYIVISSTGSAASELISIFTQKQYNHASLSFDKELATVISYNGGERVYPPGLNHEMLDFFNKKSDASILVYRLPCEMSQKKMILDKVEEINREGSAYNMLGLLIKYSHKPNIMFCSQFVYKMLQFAGLDYFDKKAGCVKPTDLIELDYLRKLEFVHEIKLGHCSREHNVQNFNSYRVIYPNYSN